MTTSLLPFQLRVLGFDPSVDCLLVENNPDGTGSNVRIAKWFSASPQPTKAELDAAIPAATDLAADSVKFFAQIKAVGGLETVVRAIRAYALGDNTKLNALITAVRNAT